MQDVHIPESLVPFVKASFLVKNDPTLTPGPIIGYKTAGFGNNYYEIETDAGLVYKGYDPFTNYHSDSEISNGDLLQSNCSKWYTGTISYTDGGNSYQIIGDLVYAEVYYNTVFVPGANNYNYTHFFTQAIDNLSGGSISGEGSEYALTWEENLPVHSWSPHLSDVHHEVHRTVNLLDSNNTVAMVFFGSQFKNGTYQGFGSFYVSSTGNYHPPTPGTAVITGFDFAQKTVQDDPSDKLWKLFYSSRRLQPLQLSSVYTFFNLPSASDMDVGASIPFNSINVKVNPDGYPTTGEQSFLNYYQPYKQQAWARMTPEDAKKETWRYFMTGYLYFTAPAIINYGTTKEFVDENWSYNGTYFDRDATNRDPKNVPWYAPASHTVQIRLILTLVNPAYYQGIQRYSS